MALSREGKQGFSIRAALPEDSENICDMIYELAVYEKAPEECQATPELIRQHLFGLDSRTDCLLAEADGVPVAYAIYFRSYSTWLAVPGIYLEDLYVKPEYRQKGIGTALLARLAHQCKENGYGRLEWSCLEWNELAKKRYRSLGAQPLEEWRVWRMTGDSLADLANRNINEEENKTDEFDDLFSHTDIVEIYTDGGCQPNPGTGAWAAVLLFNGHTKELVGGELNTTNNRMELTAAIESLKALKKKSKVILHTDSQYLKNGITTWIKNWKKKNWLRGPKGDPVKNVDLWKPLDELIQKHDVEWKWVKGHAGDEYNEVCDELCQAEIARLKSVS